ncbi:MAG: hypothetical protein ACLPSW_27335, partial [Roseiarcus sp.]
MAFRSISLGADSDEAARVKRDDAARGYEMMPPGSRVSLAVGFCVTDDGFWSRGLDLLASGSAHAFAGQFD